MIKHFEKPIQPKNVKHGKTVSLCGKILNDDKFFLYLIDKKKDSVCKICRKIFDDLLPF